MDKDHPLTSAPVDEYELSRVAAPYFTQFNLLIGTIGLFVLISICVCFYKVKNADFGRNHPVLRRISQTYLLRPSQIDVVEHFPSQIEAPRMQRTAPPPVQIPRRPPPPIELQIAVTPPVDYDSEPEIISPATRHLAQYESSFLSAPSSPVSNSHSGVAGLLMKRAKVVKQRHGRVKGLAAPRRSSFYQSQWSGMRASIQSGTFSPTLGSPGLGMESAVRAAQAAKKNAGRGRY
eukprot:257092_1